MQAVISRHNSGTTTTYRTPRKSSSVMSLRREAESPTSKPDSLVSEADATPSQKIVSRYFDAYPRPKSSPNTRPSKGKSRRVANTQDAGMASNDTSYSFPTFDPAGEPSPTPTIRSSSQHYSRTRSRTGPSGRSKWEELASVPQLRASGSTSTQNTETSLHTPIDAIAPTESFENFPEVVAAPISGVEMMDALVEGMNGGDVFSGSTSISNRARFGIPGHHPLYQPPLPTPPPGVVLGGGKSRRSKAARRSSQSSDSGYEDDKYSPPVSLARPRRRQPQTPSARTVSSSTITYASPISQSTVETLAPSYNREPISRTPSIPSMAENRKSIVPSISDIIRAHSLPEPHVNSRPSTARSSSMYAHSQGHATLQEEHESEPEPLTMEEVEMMSRSSIDSVADEVQRTLRSQVMVSPPASAPPSSFLLKRHSVMSDNASIYSPRSDPGASSSIYSSSAASNYQINPSFDNSNTISLGKASPPQAVAQYLRSARLTTLLKLTRSPHASQDNPLSVSLSDLGSPTGYPVVIFLGLGCVRHIMGLYDEMAECLGLRLITIDRWGLGRTEPRAKSAKGIMQWACVVEEVLDILHIEQCSVIAHSAGAPYALSFANKLPSRIRGDIFLLAPWVGGSESSGYKWLKYVPNGILKTAQAAEWKVQAWMIGKPPTIAYEGIGYNVPNQIRPITSRSASSPRPSGISQTAYSLNSETRSRPSMGSSSFSEYDDLGDFEGRFESRSTLGAGPQPSSQHDHASSDGRSFFTKRKPSKGFLDRLRGASTSPQTDEKTPGKRLKALRSMGSLKGKSQTLMRKSEPSSPRIPPTLHIELGLGLEELAWTNKRGSSASTPIRDDANSTTPSKLSMSSYDQARSSVRRSMSFGSSPNVAQSMPSSPAHSAVTTNFTSSSGSSTYQAALGNALIAASHAESAKGTHNDLLQILNHENHPWGFSYASYPHKARVWYGDKDEKIAENAVRWMERTMGNDKCLVKVVKGADHGLMYRSSVVVDVLECVLAAWRTEP